MFHSQVRPLPVELLKYARSDTHFLLYIYDRLRAALAERCGGGDKLVPQKGGGRREGERREGEE
jgi:hypothetical protein